MSNSPSADPRRLALAQWLDGLATLPGGARAQASSLRPASDDASFRRYFRLELLPAGATAVAMDAPPPHEDVRPFLRLRALLELGGLRVPALLAQDEAQGFLLLEDFGDRRLLDVLAMLPGSGASPDPEQATPWLHQAIALLVQWQQKAPGAGELAPYETARLSTEISLFETWYVQAHLGRELQAGEHQALGGVFEQLVASAVGQAQLAVHRDFHSRNLMALPEACGGGLGVLDFQDALWGPASYDLASLLRDAYVDWPEAVQLDAAIRYWEAARKAGLPVPERFDALWRDMEWMAVQRGLKVLGIFARLNHRDGKPRYLQDLPRVLTQVRATAGRYDALAPLARCLDRLHDRAVQTAYTF